METNEEVKLENENSEAVNNTTEFAPQDKRGISNASLVLGISSMIGWFINAGIVIACGILAIVFGVYGRKNGPGSGRGMATAGMILGIISLSLVGLFFLLGIFIGLAAIGSLAV